MKKILVVDDNLCELNGLCKLLEKSGFSVRGASGGMEALEELQREDFDLLLTDIWMPRMSGLELLRKLPKDRLPKVIMMTGDEGMETTLRRMDYEYIMKPFDPHQLVDLILGMLVRSDANPAIESAP